MNFVFQYLSREIQDNMVLKGHDQKSYYKNILQNTVRYKNKNGDSHHKYLVARSITVVELGLANCPRGDAGGGVHGAGEARPW